MFLARRLGEMWWIPGAAVFLAIGTVFAFVQPYLVTDRAAPRSRRSAAPAASSSASRASRAIPVSVEDVSDTTSQANAYAVGFGASRKVVLWSTMVDGSFSDAEVRVVLAHEIGHHSSKHIPKALAWFGLFALPARLGAHARDPAPRRDGRGRRGAARRSSSSPCIELALAPAQALISRRMEAEADWKALQTTRDPAAARKLFVDFGRTDLANPDPPLWAHVLLDSHPTLAQRVAMAEAWQARHEHSDARSACTPARSRPRAGSAGRRAR